MKFYLKFLLIFIYKFKYIIIFSIILGSLLFLFLSYILPNIKLTSKTQIGMVGRYTVDNLPSEISSLIGQGLVKIEDTGEIKPLLAQSWEMQEDGKKWVFNIRNDIYWQDKKKLNVNDINYNFSDVYVEKSGSNISFTLKEPYIPFIVLLEKPIFKKGLLGTGEWKVDKLSIKGEFLQKIVIKKDSEIKIIKFYPTEEQAKFAFKMGEIDTIQNISSSKPFNDWKDVKIEEYIKNNQVSMIFLNTQDPILSDKNIRLALNYGINKSTFKSRAIGPLNPESYFYNPQVKEYDYDPEKSKTLIKDSKVKIPNDYIIKLISSPNLIDYAEEISKSWKEIGINSDVLVSSFIPSDYQAFLTTFDIPKDPDQYSLWHSTQSETNITKYKNLRIDKLLEDGRIEVNKEERKRIYLDFQRYLVEDSPAIFLFHTIWYDIIRM